MLDHSSLLLFWTFKSFFSMFYSGNKVTVTRTQSQIAWLPVQWGFLLLLLWSLFLPFVGCVLLDKSPKPPPGLYFSSLEGLLGGLRVSPFAVLLWCAWALSVRSPLFCGWGNCWALPPCPFRARVGTMLPTLSWENPHIDLRMTSFLFCFIF